MEIQKIIKEKDVQKKRFREVKREFVSSRNDLIHKIKILEEDIERMKIQNESNPFDKKVSNNLKLDKIQDLIINPFEI